MNGGLFLQAASFALFIGVFSRRSPFLSARMAVGFALLFFAAPLVDSSLGEGALHSSQFSAVNVSWQEGVVSVVRGAVLGVAVSVGAFIALTASGWITKAVWPEYPLSHHRRGSGISALFLLVAAVSVGGVIEEIVVTFARSVVATSGEQGALPFLIHQGGRALQAAFYLTLPFVALTLVVDVCGIVVERYLAPWGSPRRGVASILTVFFLGVLSALYVGGIQAGFEHSVKGVMQLESLF